MPEWSAEVVVDEPQARALIGERFPQLAPRTLRLLGEGWDSTVWLVDERWVFRFPRREVVIAGLRRELRVLPRLAPLLPLAIPQPVFLAEPDERFRWPWVGSRLIEGREPAEAAPGDGDRVEHGRQLAAFLRALHDTDPGSLTGDGEPLPIDPVRRSDMPFRVDGTHERLARVDRLGLWRAPSGLAAMLDRARRLPPPAAPVLAHGDLHLRHLLIGDDGRLSGVIDWIDVCRADPAIDLPLYWGYLPPQGRSAFLQVYGPVSDHQLLRARVLAIFLWATLAVYAADMGLPALAREAVDGLDRAATD